MKSYILRFITHLISKSYSRAVILLAFIPTMAASQVIGFWIPLPDHGVGIGKPVMVWAGTKLVKWGGTYLSFPSPTTSGETFDPFTNTWQDMANTTIEIGPLGPAAVWTGAEIAIWGGSNGIRFYDTGAFYNPQSNTWRAMSDVNPPQARSESSAFWTGAGILMYGGITDIPIQPLNDISFYNSATDQWVPLDQGNPPDLRCGYSAVWTGSDLIVWGGNDCSSTDPVQHFADGKRYHLASQTWEPISTLNAPSPRSDHLAVWSGDAMILWGGQDSIGYLSDGASYDPNTDTWTKIPYNIPNSPSARINAYGFWIGSEMLLFSGKGQINGKDTELNDGAFYDPDTISWTPMPNNESLANIFGKQPVWTGNHMIVWGNRYISYRTSIGAGAILMIAQFNKFLPSILN